MTCIISLFLQKWYYVKKKYKYPISCIFASILSRYCFSYSLGEQYPQWLWNPSITVIWDKDKLTNEGCKGAPDWIIEIISPSSRQMDYNKKLFKYRTAGGREY